MAYYQYDPFGNERQDFLTAKLAYSITKALHPKAEMKLDDFMPKFDPRGSESDEEERPVDPGLLKSKIMSMFMRMGGKVKRGDPS